MIALRRLNGYPLIEVYDWVELSLAPSTKDQRPESRKLTSPTLNVVGRIGTDKGWLERRRIIFGDTSWHYECVDDLRDAQRVDRRSLGLVRVREVLAVKVVRRPEEDRAAHEKKLQALRSRTDLFATTIIKGLEFFPFSVRLGWLCAGSRCKGHESNVMDWGLGELGRRESISAAEARMRDLADLSKYDLHLYMGNFKAHPRNFGIVGLWYPLKREVEKYPLTQIELFS